MLNSQDNIFDYPQTVLDFSFDERTVAVFPDMIHRSIPAYAALLQINAAIAAWSINQRYADFEDKEILIYDLGCSLGANSLALKNVLGDKVKIIAVDISKPMTDKFSQYIFNSKINKIEVYNADICDFKLQKCHIVCLNFVLQFIDPNRRKEILQNIYQQLDDGGIILLAEKTKADDFLIKSHEMFKRNQGYSELAIAQKRESLENVMRTDYPQDITNRLHSVGFTKIFQYFQALPFMAWFAIK